VIRWLRRETLLAVHDEQLAEHGGLAGVRDAGQLDSVLERPKTLLAYQEPKPDLPALGAAYAFAVLRWHPFADGNKRTAFMALWGFLRLNGMLLSASDVECVHAILSTAEGQWSEEDLAQWARNHCSPIA
jgi:death on curing protein